MPSHVLAIDEGTTRVTTIVVDEFGEVVAKASEELHRQFPRPGWVEQDPLEIWRAVCRTARLSLDSARLRPADIAAIGITNQRETTVVWDRAGGTPVGPAIVWQDRRSVEICRRLEREGAGPLVSARSGLVLDPYFSATKIAWLIANDETIKRRADRDELCFGTIDSWLVWQMTGGTRHITEATNASRTMLMDLRTLEYDNELLALFGLRRSLLPEILPSGSIFGEADDELLGVGGIPITGVLGDQQSALFAQGCHRQGLAKNTYGTGSFVLTNTGTDPLVEHEPLLATAALGADDGAQYALEGSIFATGAAVQWLRDGLGLIRDPAETSAIAATLGDNDDVWFVPALVGLGAPFWDPEARGTLLGVTSATTRAHLVRAVLESIAWRTRDVLEAMSATGQRVEELRVDGGAAANVWLMQFQADVTGLTIDVAATTETTSLGAAYLAGLTVGMWASRDDVEHLRSSRARYEPAWSTDRRDALYERWQQAVARSRRWALPAS